MNGDRFVISLVGVGYPTDAYLQNANLLLADLVRMTQLDASYFNSTNADGYECGGVSYPYGAEVVSVTFDDVFTGNAANANTVKQQFDAVFSRYFSQWCSSFAGTPQIYSSTVPVATQVNPNTGQVNISHVPVAPASQSNWFDRTFFTGAGALTGVGIATLVVIGAAIFIKEE